MKFDTFSVLKDAHFKGVPFHREITAEFRRSHDGYAHSLTCLQAQEEEIQSWPLTDLVEDFRFLHAQCLGSMMVNGSAFEPAVSSRLDSVAVLIFELLHFQELASHSSADLSYGELKELVLRAAVLDETRAFGRNSIFYTPLVHHADMNIAFGATAQAFEDLFSKLAADLMELYPAEVSADILLGQPTVGLHSDLSAPEWSSSFTPLNFNATSNLNFDLGSAPRGSVVDFNQLAKEHFERHAVFTLIMNSFSLSPQELWSANGWWLVSLPLFAKAQALNWAKGEALPAVPGMSVSDLTQWKQFIGIHSLGRLPEAETIMTAYETFKSLK